MLQIKRILFPTDFSECAERAFNHASLLSARYGAELHVLNITPDEAAMANSPMGFLKLHPENGLVASDRPVTPEEIEKADVIHSQMRAPSITKGILDYATTHDVDLIVMGTHGRQGIDHLMMGSVAEDIVRNAPCPVLTVRFDESSLERTVVKRILVPIDFSEFSPLPIAIEMARAYGAELDLLHVIEEAVLPTIYGVEPLSPNAPLYIERTEGALLKLLEEAGAGDIPARQHVRIGHAPRRILEFADEGRVDLIVLGSHGRTGLSRLLIGSVAEKVVRLAPCPVFTVKSYGKALLESGESEAVPNSQKDAGVAGESGSPDSTASAKSVARVAKRGVKPAIPH